MDDNKDNMQEEFRLNGDEILSKVKEIVSEGNARRIIIQNEAGNTIIEIPLSLGIVGTLIAPALAAIGAVAALLTKCTVIVVRKEE